MADKICSECGEVNEVEKSYNCTKCRTWNKFEEEGQEIIEEETKKKGKKWLG